ncbi:hypothetical protein Tco_0189420 [Tanacetum coccineum]
MFGHPISCESIELSSFRTLVRNSPDNINKRTRTGNAFSTTTNPVRRENTGCEEARQGPDTSWTGSFSFDVYNHYAITLFDSGADYSFVSTTFIPLLGMEPNALGFSYEIKIASGQLMKKCLCSMVFWRLPLGRTGDEFGSLGDGVFVSSWVKSTNNCFGGMMLIFGLLETLEMEALVEAMNVYGC